MKKKFILGLCALSTFALTSCGGANKETLKNDSNKDQDIGIEEKNLEQSWLIRYETDGDKGIYITHIPFNGIHSGRCTTPTDDEAYVDDAYLYMYQQGDGLEYAYYLAIDFVTHTGSFWIGDTVDVTLYISNDNIAENYHINEEFGKDGSQRLIFFDTKDRTYSFADFYISRIEVED